MIRKDEPQWYKDLHAICENYDVATLKNFLRSNRLADITYKTGGLDSAAKAGNIETVKYLLTSDELSNHADIHAENDITILCAALSGSISLVNYLLFSPELTEHAYLHAQNDAIFQYASHGGYRPTAEKLVKCKSMTRYLIVDVGLKKSYYIKEFLKENPDPYSEHLFEVAHQVDILQKNLPIPNIKVNINKKI